jgi:hypothetical protein
MSTPPSAPSLTIHAMQRSRARKNARTKRALDASLLRGKIASNRWPRACECLQIEPDRAFRRKTDRAEKDGFSRHCGGFVRGPVLYFYYYPYKTQKIGMQRG